jgi:hypothetical protein
MGAVNMTADDRLAVQDLLVRYSWALDTADVDAYADLFTADARLHISNTFTEGREAIREYIARFVDRPDWLGSQHYNGQIMFEEGDSERCALRCYCMIARRSADSGTIVVRTLGTYRDVCVKSGGSWFFQQRTFEAWDEGKVADFRLPPR